jgi:MYXO-CTERM domain-containing protein
MRAAPGPALLALLCVLALAAGAAAKPATTTSQARPGFFAEEDIPLQQGQRLQWTITLRPEGEQAPYDIHSHDAASGQVVVHERGLVNGTASGTFPAPHTGTFSWLVNNALSHRTLEVSFTTEVLAAAQGSPGAKPAPGASLALVGLAGLAALALLRRR